MSAGLQVYNTGGVLQIDENYFCMSLRAKATVTTSGHYTGVPAFSYVDISYTGFRPMVALRCTSAYASVIRVSNSGTSWTFRIAVNSFSATSVTYYIFDRPAVVASGAGLEVYDASGNLTYSTAQAIAKLTLGAPGAYTLPTLSSSLTYAGVAAGSLDALEVDNGDGTSTTYYTLSRACKAVGGTTGLSIQDADCGVVAGPPGSFGDGTYSNVPLPIAVDVTGL
jgi:hypothetical protein